VFTACGIMHRRSCLLVTLSPVIISCTYKLRSFQQRNLILKTGRVEDYSHLVSEEKKKFCFKAWKLYSRYKYIMGFEKQLETPTMICMTVTASFFRA